MSTASSVTAIRRLQITRKGARAKLVSYPDEVLAAAIAAENDAADARPMFIQMLEAELERRSKEKRPMNDAAPTAVIHGQHTVIPLDQLSPSPHNRKRFDQEKMAQLTENVRVQGVIVPIIARPVIEGPTPFQIVAGERRWRAATAAGLTQIPAIVRDLTEAQAIEIQVIENNQREDVHPLEEAEGYEALMRHGTITADEIAAKINKSRSYVFGRLKLLALCTEARDAFYDGRLDASRALLLARIPVADLQVKAMNEILVDEHNGGEPMSYRDAAEHLKWEYMLRLKEAPFKTGDAELLPEAGACTTCPKRSGNQPELFADVESADVCTDPKCFAAKRDAHLAKLAEAATAKGKDVVAPRAKGYVKLDDHVKGDPNNRTYRQILGKKAPEPQLMPAVRSEGYGAKEKAELVEVVKKADVEEVVKAAVDKRRDKVYGPHASGADYEAERHDREAYRTLLFQHVLAAAPSALGVDELRWLAKDVAESCDGADVVAQFLLPAKETLTGYAVQQHIVKSLPKLDAAALQRLLIALYVAQDVDGYNGKTDRLDAAAKLYGVDVKAVKSAHELAKKEAEKPADEPTKAGSKRKGRAAAEAEEVA